MSVKKETNRRVNIFNLMAAAGVFATGLVMFIEFHVGMGRYREMFLGIGKCAWENIHRGMAIAFLTGYVIHIALHWGYITKMAKRWRARLPKKIRNTSLEQILLLTVSLIVIGAGFYAWAAFPGATLTENEFHRWIDVHNILGLLLLIGMTVHIKRRWWRIFVLRR